MKFFLNPSHLRRIESLTALLVGAFLAAFAGWAQFRYSSLEDRIAAWHLVTEEIRVNDVLLAGHRSLGALSPGDVSPSKEHRYNILIPSMVLTRGYDVVTEKGLQDLSASDLGAVAAYYLDLHTLNERIQMLQNFLVYGTLRDSDAQLMPLLMRHYASVSTAADAPLARAARVGPLVEGISTHLEAKRRRLRDGFFVSAGLAMFAFALVITMGAIGFVREEREEKAA